MWNKCITALTTKDLKALKSAHGWLSDNVIAWVIDRMKVNPQIIVFPPSFTKIFIEQEQQ